MSTGTATPPVVNDPWSMEVNSGGGGGDYQLIPSGPATATIVGLFDVGHQPETKKDGTAGESRKLVLVYELVKKGPDGKPYVIAERYTWSMNEKANFYALACNLTGTKFRDGEKFDPRRLLGMTCSVSITHAAGKKDATKTYHNVGGVQQWASEDDEGNPKPKPKPVREPVSWSAMEGKPLPDTRWVPFVYGESVASMVEASAECKKGVCPHPAHKGTTADGGGGSTAQSVGAEPDDDIPFSREHELCPWDDIRGPGPGRRIIR